MSKIIGFDFQGWPVKMLTLREMLKDLGFTEEDGRLGIGAENELLDAYPHLLEDDGMGYGVFPEFVTEADSTIYNREVRIYKETIDRDNNEFERDVVDEEIPVFNVFREPTHLKIEEVIEDDDDESKD